LGKTYLEKSGAQVDIAGNGIVALEMIQKNKYSIILMDVQMPILDGISTTKKIRSDLQIEIPIIGCSAHALSSEKERCLEAGMNKYIAKPYKESELIQVLYDTIHANPAPKNTTVMNEIVFEEKDDILSLFRNLESEFDKETCWELRKLLIDNISTFLEHLDANFEAKEFDRIATQSHSLSGSLGSLKFLEGLKLSKKLELSARNQDLNAAQEAALALKTYLEILVDRSERL
jgi:CheY-like chemotaxis protein/HPt (histidine-containing phosphotransfer) domain-containing protein